MDDSLAPIYLEKVDYITRISEYFIKLQKDQDEELKNKGDDEHWEKVLLKYKELWNQFIKNETCRELIINDVTFYWQVICDEWNIPECVFSSVEFREDVYFSRTNFEGFVRFLHSSFKSTVSFSGASFHYVPDKNMCAGSVLDFERCIFENDLDIYHAKLTSMNFSFSDFLECAEFGSCYFLKEMKFVGVNFKGNIFVNLSEEFIGNSIVFDGVTFEKEAEFSARKLHGGNCVKINNSIAKDRVRFLGFWDEVNLDKSEFGKSVYFEELPENQSHKKYIGCIEKISFDRTVFNGLTVFDVNFNTMPNFFKAAFKQTLINEKWDKTEINKDSENNFRFLKDYYLKQNNHQRELEYFGREMAAKEKYLSCFRKIPYLLYNITSNYGNSVLRPLWWLTVSFISFGRILGENFCLGTDGYFVSLARTIFPLVDIHKVFLQNVIIGDNVLSGILLIQTLINSILLFLLLLGIRNKFKIK